VALVYRLPADLRASWRQACRTQPARTDAKRREQYERWLATGQATIDELPFYRR
jgi:hypothetical protein